MVEIRNSKKNIIILFIIMIILLFFLYKGFIADSSHYLEEYKNYLIKINASKYYFKKIEKNKNRLDKKENKELGKVNNILSKIKEGINKSNNITKIVKSNLETYNDTNLNELNKVIKNLEKTLDNIEELEEILTKYYIKNI